jgi:hypothetical protein
VSQQYNEIEKRFQPEAQANSASGQRFSAENIRVKVSKRICSTAFERADTWLDLSGLLLAFSQLA